MAKEYKDHGAMGGGRAYGNRFLPRLVFSVLLVTVAILGYSYWDLMTRHRDATTKSTQLRQELDTVLSARADLNKMMDSCKDELKSSGEDLKRLKDIQATLDEQMKTLMDTKSSLENEKTLLEEKSKKELSECQDSVQQEVSKCNASCNDKINEAKTILEEECKKQQIQLLPTIRPDVQAGSTVAGLVNAEADIKEELPS